MELSVVIPAFNEAQKIARDVAAADAFVRARCAGGEIVVVDDGSSDGTAQAARALQASYETLRVVSYERNRGKGHAIAQGVAQARGEIVMFADAGLCVPYEMATVGLTMIAQNMCEIAHGSRRLHGSVARAQPFYRRAGSHVYRTLVRGAMAVPRWISDTQCGFKLYRREVAAQLYGQLLTDGFMFDVEIILRALRQRYRIVEFPVLWNNDADTRFDPIAGSLRNLRELAHIRRALAAQKSSDEPTHALARERVHVT